jgi:hypothetical protein
MDNNFYDEFIDNLPENIKQEIKKEDLYFEEIENDDFLYDLERKQLKEDTNNEKEIEKLFRKLEKEIDAEVEKEISLRFEPIDKIEEENKKRAREIIKNDELINQACQSNLITFEEVVYYIDYYELITLMNRAHKNTMNILDNINNLGQDTDVDDLRQRILKRLTIDESVLDVNFDYNKFKLYLTENEKNDNISEPNNETNTDKVNKETIRSMSKTINELKRNNFNKGRISIKSINKQNNILKSSIELFPEGSKPTNLLKVRDIRKERIRYNVGGKSKNSDLFKFDFKQNEEKIKKQFLEIIEMPYKLTEQIPELKSNPIKKKIEEARNYYKNKFDNNI